MGASINIGREKSKNKIIKIENKGKGFFINILPFPNPPNL